MSAQPETCPACEGVKVPSRYLCRGCWFTLQPAARRALNKSDEHAMRRLGQLREQLRAGVALHLIQISATPPVPQEQPVPEEQP